MSLKDTNRNYSLSVTHIFQCLVLVALLCSTAIHAQPSAANMQHPNQLAEAEAFNKGSAAFATNLYSQFGQQRANENLIYSPLSIETTLAMVSMGADGQTAGEIYKALGVPPDNVDAIAEHFHRLLTTYKDSEVLSLANKMYIKIGLNLHKQFENVLTTKFYSRPEQLHFADSTQSARTINTWVAGQTKDHIKDLVSPSMLNEDTLLVLVNAIHFKGDWLHPFSPRSTRDERFYLNEHDFVQVPMMHLKERFLYGELPELEASALEMPYKNSNLSMFIILPNSRNGLAGVEQKLKGLSLGDLKKSMQRVRVNVKLPKFKSEFTVELNEALKELGIQRMFTDEAEFGKMLDAPGSVKVSKVIHKAFIEVNELGTEAAAATDIVIRKVRSLEDIAEFIADRPFVYVIGDGLHATMFMGSYRTAEGVREHDEL